MWTLALIPFFLQALCMFFDEGYFHIRRGLPLWERIGHPIDTFSVLVCMVFILVAPFSPFYLGIYIFLAIFSSVLVTKDEFVHKTHCSGAENWLHALLFTLHPITLTMAGFIWPISQGASVSPWIHHWLSEPQLLRAFLKTQCAFMSFFLIYQVLFWNIIWKNKPVIKE